MIECSNCEAPNQDGAAICYRCGSPLDDGKPTEGKTRQFNGSDTGPVIPRRKWGTARFDNQTVILLHVRGYDQPLRVLFGEEELVIGRSHETSSVDVDLTEHGAIDAGVSRRHALLRRQNETIVLVDLNSANGTFLNGQRIISNEPRILRDGDELRLGRLVIRTSFEENVFIPGE